MGTFREYFQEAEKIRDSLPVLDEEINFICDGCYSSQSRIKAGNIRSERFLRDADGLCQSECRISKELSQSLGEGAV